MKYPVLKSAVLIITACLTLISFSSCNIKKSDKDNSTTDKENNSTNSTTTDYSYINSEFSSSDLDAVFDESTAVKIKLNKTSAEISGAGAKANGSIVTISGEGDYLISGELENGRVIIDSGKKKNIRVILNGAKITCKDNSPFYIKKANKAIITLAKDSENVLSDGESYNNNGDDANVDGALFSRSDLTLNGAGKLTVNGNYKHGIVCKDNLVVASGEYKITSKSGGIYGKDSVRICDGIFEINGDSNGIKATNADENEKGYIYLKNGDFNIVSQTDGIEAVDCIKIDGGSFNIKTGGGSSNASVKQNGKPNEDWGQWGKRPDEQKNPPNDGNMTPPDNNNGRDFGNPPDDMGDKPEMNREMQNPPMEQTSNNTSENAIDSENSTSSAKGIKSDKGTVINGGKISIDSSDDSIHSNGNIFIAGGEITLSSGDDGIHSDTDLIIQDGDIKIEKSYEGIEGASINIAGGNVDINASDDGINAGGGSDTGITGRMGQDKFSAESNNYILKISGGKLIIDAEGDGLDSNGDLIVEGGEIYVSGPTNDGNGALDYGENGKAYITGGTIIACGSTGMAEVFGEENSTQNAVLHNFTSRISSGSELKIVDSNGKTILRYTPEKDYQSVVFSCSDLKNGTYTISAGDISDEITIDSVITSNGRSNRMGGRGMRIGDKS